MDWLSWYIKKVGIQKKKKKKKKKVEKMFQEPDHFWMQILQMGMTHPKKDFSDYQKLSFLKCQYVMQICLLS